VLTTPYISLLKINRKRDMSVTRGYGYWIMHVYRRRVETIGLPRNY